MKANPNDATHYNERTDEYWLLEDGVYASFNRVLCCGRAWEFAASCFD